MYENFVRHPFSWVPVIHEVASVAGAPDSGLRPFREACRRVGTVSSGFFALKNPGVVVQDRIDLGLGRHFVPGVVAASASADEAG